MKNSRFVAIFWLCVYLGFVVLGYLLKKSQKNLMLNKKLIKLLTS